MKLPFLKWVIMAGMLFACATTSCLAAGKQKIVLALSNDQGPYQEIRETIHGAFNGDVQEIILSENYRVASSEMLGVKSEETRCIIAMGQKAVSLAASIAPEIPIYYSLVYSPAEYGERKSLGILVGIDMDEQIEMLHSLFPERKNIGVFFNPEMTGALINDARKKIGNYHMSLMAVPVGSREEIPAACDRFSSGVVDLLLLVADRTVVHPESLKTIADFARQNKIPLVGLSKYHVNSGAMVAFTVNFKDVGDQLIREIQENVDHLRPKQVEKRKTIDILINEPLMKELGVEDLNPNSKVVYIQ